MCISPSSFMKIMYANLAPKKPCRKEPLKSKFRFVPHLFRNKAVRPVWHPSWGNLNFSRIATGISKWFQVTIKG